MHWFVIVTACKDGKLIYFLLVIVSLLNMPRCCSGMRTPPPPPPSPLIWSFLLKKPVKTKNRELSFCSASSLPLDGFDWHWHYQASVQLPLNRAVNKHPQRRINFFRDNSPKRDFRERGESNPDLLDEKRKCCLCDMPPPHKKRIILEFCRRERWNYSGLNEYQ